MSNNKKIKPQDIDADDVVENVEVGTMPEAKTDNVTEDYGKFDSLQELLSAYNALQSEFTKRCQLIKQLQAQLEESNAQAQASAIDEREEVADGAVQASNAPVVPLDINVAQSSVCDVEARIAEAVAVIAENIDECADYFASLPQIADAVILSYKKKLLGAQGVSSPRGMAVVMPAHRPKTLADAKRLADEMLKSGR